MSDPTTSNILLAVPTRGSDAGTWDLPVNNNSTAIDGYVGGVQTISLSTGTVNLTAPAGVVTATSGPTQSQNAVLKLTGALSGNVQVKLPLPGYYIIDNQCTGSLANIITFAAAGAGQVICIDYGETQHIYNDGTNVRFCNLGRIGATEIWAGINSMPAWVVNCTVPPYLTCDGTVYNISTYPILGKKLGSQFGGNGTTTFGVPDLRGRLALPFDPTGTRITAAGCGIAGNVIGAAADVQAVSLTVGQIPNGLVGNNANNVGISTSYNGGHVPTCNSTIQNGGFNGAVGANLPFSNTGTFSDGGTVATGTIGSGSISVQITNTGGQSHTNVQPSQVTGIAVIRAA